MTAENPALIERRYSGEFQRSDCRTADGLAWLAAKHFQKLQEKDMSKKIISCVWPCLILAMAVSSFGQAPRGAAPPPRPDNAQSLAHIDAAKKIAGTDLTAPFNFFCIPANTRANNVNAPELEPVRIFDNL